MSKLTIIEIYDMIRYVTSMSAIVKSMNPISTITEDKATRLGNIQAIKNSWYYFNNQEEFKKLPLIDFYYGKDLDEN